jgi:hypothetical protein
VHSLDAGVIVGVCYRRDDVSGLDLLLHPGTLDQQDTTRVPALIVPPAVVFGSNKCDHSLSIVVLTRAGWFAVSGCRKGVGRWPSRSFDASGKVCAPST